MEPGAGPSCADGTLTFRFADPEKQLSGVRLLRFVDRLREIGVALFGDGDPTAVHYRGQPYRVSREDGMYVLHVALPFTERGELHLSRRSDELVLQVGAWRRTLVLPRALIDAPTKGAKMTDGTLRIQFEAPAKAGHRGGRR